MVDEIYITDVGDDQAASSISVPANSDRPSVTIRSPLEGAGRDHRVLRTASMATSSSGS